MGYGWHDNVAGGGWWVLMAICMFVFLAVFVTGVVLLARHYSQPRSGPGDSGSAIKILQDRFARGEISEEEYTRRLALLKSQS